MRERPGHRQKMLRAVVIALLALHTAAGATDESRITLTAYMSAKVSGDNVSKGIEYSVGRERHWKSDGEAVRVAERDRVSEGCPDPEESRPKCGPGETTTMTGQTLDECPRFVCVARNVDDDDDAEPTGRGTKVVLPAVLGTLLSLLVVGLGAFFYIRWKRRRGAGGGAKRLSSYNDLINIARDQQASRASDGEKWASAQDTVRSGPADVSRGSIPVFYPDAADHATASARQTVFYPSLGSVAPAAPRPGPAKPQLVHLNPSASTSHTTTSTAHAASYDLSLNLANIRLIKPAAQGSAESPETPIHGPPHQLGSQMPRIIQFGAPKASARSRPTSISTIIGASAIASKPLSQAARASARLSIGDVSQTSLAGGFARDVLQATRAFTPRDSYEESQGGNSRAFSSQRTVDSMDKRRNESAQNPECYPNLARDYMDWMDIDMKKA